MRILPWFLTLLGCVVVTGALAGIKYRQISAAMAMAESFPPPYHTVTVDVAQGETWTPIRRLTGSVRAPQFLQLAAEAPGRIVSLPFQAGETVPEGEVILKLFDDDLINQRDALSADQELVRTQLRRIQKLREDKLASQDQLDTLLAQNRSLQARIGALNAQISRMTLTAPFTGRLGIYTQSLGDLMQAGDVLTTLTGAGNVRWVDFKVPQGVARVNEGDTVSVLSIDNELLGEATIIAVSDALATGIRAYDVRARIEDSGLRHGELVQVEVRTGPSRPVLKLSNRAVRWDTEGALVYAVIDAEEGAFQPHKAEARRVSILDERGGKVFVSGNILAGEAVAAEGAFKLYDEALIVVSDGSKPE